MSIRDSCYLNVPFSASANASAGAAISSAGSCTLWRLLLLLLQLLHVLLLLQSLHVLLAWSERVRCWVGVRGWRGRSP